MSLAELGYLELATDAATIEIDEQVYTELLETLLAIEERMPASPNRALVETDVVGALGGGGVSVYQDKGIPPEAVDAFAKAMKEAGESLELHRYDAPHEFANPSGAHYDAKAAEDAWGHVRAFFAAHLRG